MVVTRSDFKFYNGKFYLLEINTQPGMTKLSQSEIAQYKGISFLKLIEWMLKDASKKSKKIVIYFLLIIVSSINNSSINNIKFNRIENIFVSGLSEKDNQIFK